jgi:pyrroline-5-carboxylate reductase
VKAPILLVGAGRMGGALLRGWIAGAIGPVVVVEPRPSAALKKLKVRRVATIADAPAEARAVVVALKPQVLKTEAAALRRFNKALVVSIAAGTSTRTFTRAIGPGARVIRAMPNTPGSIGQGITALYAGKGIRPKDKALAVELLSALGETVWVKRETDIDAVTAVSGSGPAYVFLMVEALADAARAVGLPRPLAEKLARATVAGSGALLTADASTPAVDLRRNVTSPGGTTEAALQILMAKQGLTPLMRRAVAAARKRARALGA